MKTPSVLIKGSNAAEAIENNRNGFLCDNTVEDFAQAVKNALSDIELYLRVAENAQKTLCRSWENVVDEAAQKYQSILNRWSR
jgi:glycosyltransferase involved in cell wall biosynthesis